jgi:uncharacterized membrane protein
VEAGAAWAAGAGVLFGLFQALSVLAVRRAVNVTLVTFVQVAAAAVVIGVVAAAVEGLGRLGDATAYSLLMFVLAGIVHFFVGWAALNRSQERIGAARTAPLIATSPAFGVLIALLVYGELPGAIALGGIAVTMVGAYVLTDPGAGRRAALADSGWGLTTAAAWALSAILTVRGLADFPYPLLGVAIGTWWRWLGLDQAPIGVVLALNLLSVPSVLVFAPLLARRGEEVVTGRLVTGSTVVIAGALTLVLA